MQFEVFGPYPIRTASIIKGEHIRELRDLLREDQEASCCLEACGCYVFAVKNGAVPMPCYIGKAERQSVFSEATNRQHLQRYNEILDEYERGTPLFYFLPAHTRAGRPQAPAQGDQTRPAVEFLENWLIARALQRNPKLWNIRGTRFLKDLHVRGLFNPKPGDQTLGSQDLKRCLG